ncbi:DUF6193 family natural product biosynthesis protein [Streptomyces iranensis]
MGPPLTRSNTSGCADTRRGTLAVSGPAEAPAIFHDLRAGCIGRPAHGGAGLRQTWGILYIQPAVGDTYWVSGPLRSRTVGPAATAQEAIAMVVQRLPADCGPAFLGNPEELAAHEATAEWHQTDEG